MEDRTKQYMKEVSEQEKEIKALLNEIEHLEQTKLELCNQLHSQETLYAKILDALPMNIFLEDKEGRTVFVNEEACKCNNLPKEKLLGQTVFDFFPPEVAKYTREKDLKVWASRKLITEEEVVEFQGKKTHMYTGKTVIQRGNGTEDFMLGFGLDITEQKMAEEKIKYMAYHDSLTDLPNRWALHNCLEELIKNNKSANVHLLLLDLDQFKVVNDSLGHQAGDDLLQAVAKRLKNVLNKNEIIGRLGGDEFLFILPDLSNDIEIDEICGKILEVIEAPFLIHDQRIIVSTSIGVSIFPEHGNDIHALIQNADIAMYQAKGGGRRGYRIFQPQMNYQIKERLDMEVMLRNALEKNEFVLHYQPKMNVETGNPVGFEALIRWNSHAKGLIYPNDFIKVAEETELIVPIGKWVLKEACQQCREWHNEGLTSLTISVNISVVQFYKGDLEKTVAEVLFETSLPPNALELELTETILMKEPDKAAFTLRNLKNLGVHISIDDFGKGFSSLSYLKNFPMDTLKIDKSFVFDCHQDKADQSIILSVITLAHNLGLNVVAEGVENKEQQEFLKKLHCDITQDYYHAYPMEPKETINYLSKWLKLVTILK